MLSELFRIPYSIAGVPLFGFGLLLLLWLAGGAFSIFKTLRRSGSNGADSTGEVFSQLLLVGLGAVAIVGLPRIFPEGLPIRGYGLMLVVAAGVGIALASYRAEQLGIARDVIYSLAMWLFIFGIVGARVFYVIEYWESEFRSGSLRETVAKALNFPQGGLVVYGAFIGATIGFLLFVRKHRLPVLATADLLAPSLLFGLAIGRLGCLLNGCCFGGPCDRQWAITFPPHSPPYNAQIARGEMYGFRLAADAQGRPRVEIVQPQSEAAENGLEAGSVVSSINGESVQQMGQAAWAIDGIFGSGKPLVIGILSGESVRLPPAIKRSRSLPIHPTQIYSTINATLIGLVLWTYYPFRRRDGEVVALMLSIYPITRFLLEIIRTDESAIFGTGMSISQNVSVLILAGVAAMWIYLLSRPARLAFAVKSPNTSGEPGA